MAVKVSGNSLLAGLSSLVNKTTGLKNKKATKADDEIEQKETLQKNQNQKLNDTGTGGTSGVSRQKAVDTDGTGGTQSNKYTNPEIKGTATIPNTNIEKVVNKKGGVLPSFALGGVLGALGTSLAGVANTIVPDPNTSDTEDPFGTTDTTGGTGTFPEWYTEAETGAAGILDEFSDVPIVGDVVTAAEEGGWSLPLLVIGAGGAVAIGVFVVKKIAKKTNNKPAPKAKKTTKKPNRKNKRSAKK